MRITRPARNAALVIDSKPSWPALVFETDAVGAHIWKWTITWRHFTKSGRATSDGPSWDAAEAIADRGGTLVVRATAGAKSAGASVKITGTNPSEGEVKAYLGTHPDADVMFKIIRHETKFVHFRSRGEPTHSFDSGFGLCQLTTPRPSFEEVWNWQRNIDAGLRLFAEKRRKAITDLSVKKRSYTAEQLTRETVCRWNGGPYHVWDEKAAAWVRPSTVLCDTKTGNMGWDMTDAANKGKTEAELHKRDAGSYSAPPDDDAHWAYSGVCYADAVLG